MARHSLMLSDEAQARMTASGAKRLFGDRALNRDNFEPCARSVDLCTLLPNTALRTRPNVRYEGQPGKLMLAPSSSQFDSSLPFGDQFCCVAHQRILFHDLGISEHAVRLRLWSEEALATYDRYLAALRKTASRVVSR